MARQLAWLSIQQAARQTREREQGIFKCQSLQAFRFCRLAELQRELFANQTRRAGAWTHPRSWVPVVVKRCGKPSLKTDKRPTSEPKWHRITFAPRARLEWHGDRGETQAMASIAGSPSACKHNGSMPFWPLRPVRAQNQLRFGLIPQQPLTVMRRQAFGFGLARSFCVSCCKNRLCNGVSTMGCSPHSMRWSISSPGCSAVVAHKLLRILRGLLHVTGG